MVTTDLTTTGHLRDVPRVLVLAARLVAGHWPALVVLAFTGVAVRSGAVWAAVEVSDHVPALAQMLLLLAPLGYLLPMIAMLRILGASLPGVHAAMSATAPDQPTEHRPRRLVDVMVSVFVPFLAVYSSYGLLAADRDRFTNEAAWDEFNQTFTQGGTDFTSRLAITSIPVLLGLVGLAWVVRWALGRFELRTRFLALAFVGALVEVYWTGQAARFLAAQQENLRDWFLTRRAVQDLTEVYTQATELLGPLTDPVRAFTSWALGLLGSLDAVVVVPVAWLTVGAVVLGHRLMPAPPLQHPLLDRLAIVPEPVRRAAGSLTTDLRGRWVAFWNGLRMLGNAGLLPMLAFCLTFLVVIRLPAIVSEVARVLVGPVPAETFRAFVPWESAVGLALSMALTAPMLAAAVEWFVTPRTPAARAAPAPALPEPEPEPQGTSSDT
ncbi:hypothetical protein [Antribacter gilvus]|uniref:hypothetical protein n=1 Tax=Antribacter gilvus TaxID=2304675 RepID=UPI000F7A35F3|nr:hypothetical protein [Antribacter gilvus]